MPAVAEEPDFIPAPLATDDFIPAPVAETKSDGEFVPSTFTPEQTVTELMAGAESHSDAVQRAEPYFDNPNLRPLLVKALVDRQKRQDSRTDEDRLKDAAKVAWEIPKAGVKTLWSVVHDTIPAVATNIYDIFGMSDGKRQRALGEAGAALTGAAASAHELGRKAIENLSDSFSFGAPSLSGGMKVLTDPVANVAVGRPATILSDEEYAKRAEADILGARTIRQAAEGDFLPGDMQKEAAAAGLPVRPEQSQALQVAYDPQNWVPFGAGFVVGKVGNALGLGVRTAGGVEVVAKGLQKMSEVEAAAQTAGAIRKGIGGATTILGSGIVKAGDSPAVAGTIAGAAALASGAEPTTAMLASLIGAGASKRSSLISSALDKTGQTLVRVGDQIAGKASLGPMGKFAESAVNFVKPAVEEGATGGLVMGSLFAISARDEQEVADTLGSAAAFGIGGHLVGQVTGAANRYFSIDSAFRDPTTKVPDSAYERPEFTHYSPDQGHPVEAKAKEVFDTLSNKGAQTVEALKKVFAKPDVNGIKTEIYVLDRATSDALAKEYAGTDQGRAGFSVEIPDQKRRLVVINADSNNGISLGHEVGHAFYESLPDAQKQQLLDTVTNTLRPDDFQKLKTRYEELFNRKRNEDGSFSPLPESERVKISDDYAAKEYLAENFSAYLNGIPIEKFGTPRNIADTVRVAIGAALEKSGARRLTTDNSAPVRTELGYKPSAALAELYQNFIEARKLDNTTVSTVNGEAAPTTVTLPPVENSATKPANAPAPVNAPSSDSPLSNVRDVETKPVAPGFKKGDPIGEIRDKKGMLIAEDAKVLKKNEDGTYEIEFIDPDSGKRQIATTDEASLTSPVSPGKVDPNKTVFPKSPVTPETPFGAATAPVPATAVATVAPKQVENVARPEASVAAPSLRAGAASKFASKAPDALHIENRKTLESLMSAPRAEIPAIETDYYSAASPVQAPDAAVRTAQRKAADALEKSSEPNPFRSTFQKLFVPYRWSSYKLDTATNARLYGDQAPRQPGGIYGMSVDKVGQNLDLLRGLAKDTPAVAKTLNDFGVSPEYLGSNELVSDFQTYLNNQAHGYGGDGKALVLPTDTRPGTITPRDPNYTPVALPTDKRQLFNLLLNFEQQSSRTAGMEFSARFAKENGIDPLVVGRDDKGRPLTDNNELRAALLKTGFDPRILNSAVENLPTENFTSKLKVRPDVALPAADVAITQAGFMPEAGPKPATTKDFTPENIDGILSRPGWAILTSENPDGKPQSKAQNEKALAGLKANLDKQGVKYEQVLGKYGQEENSLLVLDPDMTHDKASVLANKYRQDSVLTKDGLVYRDGSLLPATGVEKFDTPPNDNFTKIGDAYFSVKFGREFGDALPSNSPEVRALRDSGAFMPEAQFDAPKRLPDAIKDKTLTLVHKGAAGVSELNPAQFGKSGITPRSELSGEPRVFFYVKGFENKGDPSQLRGTSYEIPISGKRIYNADTDNLNWTQDVNRQRADIMLKDAGYAGLIRSRGKGKNEFKQVEIFEKVSTDGTPVSDTETRTPRNRLDTPEGREVAAQLRKKYGSTGAYFDRLNEYKDTGKVRFMPESPDTPSVPKTEEKVRGTAISYEDGTPIPLYHGTDADFKRYQIGSGMYGDVVYLTPSKKEAGEYGSKQIEVVTDLQKPAYLFSSPPEGMKLELHKAVKDAGLDPVRSGATLDRFYEAAFDTALETKFPNAVNEVLKKNGYDGLVASKESQGPAATRNAWVMPFSTEKTFRTDTGARFMPEAPDTPEFKKWFGGSKVVDESGNPKVVYHGTDADFTRFKRRVGDIGMHFGTSDQANDRLAYTRGRDGGGSTGVAVMPIYLSLKNPLRLPDVGAWNAENLKPDLLDLFPSDSGRIGSRWGSDGLKSTASIREFIESKGFDGVVYKNTGEVGGSEPFREAVDSAKAEVDTAFGKGKNGFTVEDQKNPAYLKWRDAMDEYARHRETNAEDSYIAFDPTQIKSATGNKGTFDASNPDIRYMPEDDVRLTRPYKEIAKYLTPDERSKVRKDTAADMVDVFKDLPPDSEFEAAAKMGMLKKGWYERAGRSLRTIFGNDTEKFVGVLAATSPRQSVQLNMEMAFDIWEKYLEAGRPEDAASIKGLVRPLVGLPSRENNTVRALSGKDLEDNPLASSKKFDEDTKMSGFKVESFRRNLLGDLQASTNDAWMAQFAGISQALFGTKAGYSAFNAKVRRVADTLNIKPAEVQETVWSFFKTLVEGTKEGRTSAETLASLTQGDILNTPEFHEELLRNPKVAGVLERLGIDTAAILNNENPAKSGADPTLPLAGITLERGQDSRRVLERVVARAQKIKDQSLADETTTRNRIAPTDEENPF